MSVHTPGQSVTALDRARARYSREELLIRYARGRIRHVWMRQSMTGLGGIVLWFSNGPTYAIAAMLLAALGELVDCLCLHHILRSLRQTRALRRAYLLSTLSGTFQALTIAACVAIGWFGPVSHSAPLFALSFLLGTAMNAGLLLPYHPASGKARLTVYGLTLIGLLLSEVILRTHDKPGFALNVGGATMLVYMVAAFLVFVNGSFARNRKKSLDMTRRSMELAQANDQLVARERELKRLSLVARHANDAVLLSDPKGRTTWVNEAFMRATGLTADDILGKRPGEVLDFTATDPEVLSAIRDSALQGRAFLGEIRFARRDGTVLCHEVNQVPVLNQEGAVETLVAVSRDVTEAKIREKELLAAKRASEDSARAKAEFLATMSHEIRTPMNGIIGMSDLLMDTPLDSDQRLYADTIRGSAQGLLAIINDILDLSKLDAGKMSLAPVDFDLTACLTNTVQLLAPQAEAKGILLRLDLPADLPARVHGDDLRLRQILLNLIGNAVKFTEEGAVRVGITMQPDGDQHRLSVAVEDTGIGIAPAHLGQVFERFSQAEASTTRRFGGTGLGLTISKLLAKAMGGDITVTSQPGKGSCFTLTLCLSAAQSDEPSDTTGAQAGDLIAQIKGLRVLVAEDNRVNRIVIEKFLADTGIKLAFATNGAEAVAQTQSFAPDFVFMDMSMPVMDGIQATRHIRATPGPQPVIVALTANAFATDRAKCLRAGMDGFLSKPVRRHDILTSLARPRHGLP
ncbi:MAG: ATP-binding protein [Aestuariivita sp.]|uniref:PAS domain-containing hybrid sensor histidine kinase/response regulator n=1 Tax=Aestuariivita sp. TaxID=1872407 RepID=UPI003BB0D3D0